MLGEILGAVGSVFGGLLGKSSADKQIEAQKAINQQNIDEAIRAQNANFGEAARARDWQRSEDTMAFNLSNNAAAAARQEARNYAIQDQAHADAMENSKIQRLVADAKIAGIHPLAALGSNAASYLGSAVQPVFGPTGTASAGSASVGSGSPASLSYSPVSDPSGDAIGNAISALAEIWKDSASNRLVEAQIRNLDAETAQTLTKATSRTIIGKVRAAGQGGPGSGFHESVASRRLVGGDVVPKPAFKPESTFDDIMVSLNQAWRSLRDASLKQQSLPNVSNFNPVVNVPEKAWRR